MSRDFELLQRLEREWGRPSTLPEVSSGSASSEAQRAMFRVVPGRIPAATHPASQLNSEVRAELNKLIFRIFLAASSANTVMFTGIEAQENAKWLAACTADLLATASRARVCLIDLDFNSPAMHQAYSIPNEKGVSDVIAGSCSLDSATLEVSENLWVLPAGTKAASNRFEPESVRNILSDLLRQCEYLVVSSPNFEAYPDLAAIGTATEGVVLVMDSATTRRSSAQRAKAMLEAAQVRVIGSVLANRHSAIPEFLYARL